MVIIPFSIKVFLTQLCGYIWFMIAFKIWKHHLLSWRYVYVFLFCKMWIICQSSESWVGRERERTHSGDSSWCMNTHTAKIGVSCVNSVKWTWNDFVWSLFDKTLVIVWFTIWNLFIILKGQVFSEKVNGVWCCSRPHWLSVYRWKQSKHFSEESSYRFETTWRWVNNNWILILEWTVSLRMASKMLCYEVIWNSDVFANKFFLD